VQVNAGLILLLLLLEAEDYSKWANVNDKNGWYLLVCSVTNSGQLRRSPINRYLYSVTK